MKRYPDIHYFSITLILIKNNNLNKLHYALIITKNFIDIYIYKKIVNIFENKSF